MNASKCCALVTSMYESRLAAPSTILFSPKYGRAFMLTGTSVSARPATMIAGLPRRLPLRIVALTPSLHARRAGVGARPQVALADRAVDVQVLETGRRRQRREIDQRAAGALVVDDVDARAQADAVEGPEDLRQRRGGERHDLARGVGRGEGESAEVVGDAELAIGVGVGRHDRRHREPVVRRVKRVRFGLPAGGEQLVERLLGLLGGRRRRRAVPSP